MTSPVLGLQQIQGDIESPFLFNSHVAAEDANLFFAASQTLFVDSSTQNITAANVAAMTPPSLLTPLAGLEELVHGDVGPLPPIAMMESITDSAMEANKMRTGSLE